MAPFTVPPRTVRAIIQAMTEEAARALPPTPLALDSLESLERAPGFAARILDEELKRLQRTQAKRPLTDEELERLSRLAVHGERIARTIRSVVRATKPAGEGTRGRRTSETAVERLVREEAERKERGEQPTRTHTYPEASTRPSEPAASIVQPPPGTDQRDADLHDAIDAARSQRSPVELAEIAEKARAALA